jgi:hypothetical protein
MLIFVLYQLNIKTMYLYAKEVELMMRHFNVTETEVKTEENGDDIIEPTE